jgi:hypothetical protein
VPSWTPALSKEGPNPVPCTALLWDELFDGGLEVGLGFTAGVLGAFVAVTFGLAGILLKRQHFYLKC